MSKEVYMSPVNFQGPAGGVMTQSFEEELERRVEQANPGEEPWQSVWSRTLLCNRWGGSKGSDKQQQCQSMLSAHS